MPNNNDHNIHTCEMHLCADPEIVSIINVADITQTSVRVSWSKGQTQVVSSITVYYRATTTWTSVSPSSHSTAYTVSTLQPGTQYYFYVKIVSYGKYSTSDTITMTTGKFSQLLYVCLPIIILHFFRFWFTYLNICENCNTFCKINP